MDYREEIINALVEVCKKARSEGFASAKEVYTRHMESSYRKGLEDAWESARKIVLGIVKGGIHSNDLYKIFGTQSADKILETVSADEAVQKIKEYENQKQDATDTNDGSIKVGDEVRIKGSDPVKDDCDYGICTRSLPKINTMYVMRRDGSSGEENKDEWYRTGRTFPQIAEVLEQLGGEEE